MLRDIRDPKATGEAILAERARNPRTSVCAVADHILHGSMVRNYGETDEQYRQRWYEKKEAARDAA